MSCLFNPTLFVTGLGEDPSWSARLYTHTILWRNPSFDNQNKQIVFFEERRPTHQMLVVKVVAEALLAISAALSFCESMIHTANVIGLSVGYCATLGHQKIGDELSSTSLKLIVPIAIFLYSVEGLFTNLFCKTL